MKQALNAMADTVEKSGRETAGKDLGITHCNNEEMAKELKGILEKRFDFGSIFVLPTGGLSSMYADENGLIMAY